MQTMQVKKLRFINADFLKLLAAALMLIDHIGMIFFDRISPQSYWILRKIGRLSMPLFAFAIAEGCRYTRNKPLHFAMLFGLGLICFFVYAIALDQIYYNILITFSFSVGCIYALQFMKAKYGKKSVPPCSLSAQSPLPICFVIITPWITDFGVACCPCLPLFSIFITYLPLPFCKKRTSCPCAY